MNLRALAEAARENDLHWDQERAARVLASTIAGRERRVVRAKMMRRSFAAASAVAVLGVLLLRVGSAPASTVADSAPSPSATASELALAREGDGGYGRD